MDAGVGRKGRHLCGVLVAKLTSYRMVLFESEAEVLDGSKDDDCFNHESRMAELVVG